MRYRVLGLPSDGPTLDLDHRRFSYAGKFVMSNTGKAVAETPNGTVVGAVAFNRDRTDERTWWLRYVTVRSDRRGEGIGPRLIAFTARHLSGERADKLRIAVNNPFAFEALYKAGFGFTGERTGIAELVLERPPPGPEPARYHAGLTSFLDREDLGPAARRFVTTKRDAGRPEPVTPPDAGDGDTQ